MDKTYSIYQKTLFSKHYYVKDEITDVIDIKYKFLPLTGATAKFDGGTYQLKSGFLNNKFFVKRIDRESTEEYKIDYPPVGLKASFVLEGKEYTFTPHVVTKVWNKYSWRDDGDNIYIEYIFNGIKPKKDGQIKVYKDLPEKQKHLLMAVGLYLIYAR